MSSIVEYTDQKRPRYQYPSRIISPPRPGPCCERHMAEVGRREEGGRWVFRYKRCRRCGFTVRLVLEALPDPRLMAELRATFLRTITRGY